MNVGDDIKELARMVAEMLKSQGFMGGDRFLPVADVSRKVGLCKTTIYNYVSKGTFPAPIPTGTKRVAWLESEIDTWMQSHVNQRNNARNQNA
jgi:prophage regulatory protein